MGVAAYTIWGLLPLYLALLEPAGPIEILAHRIVWSMVFLSVLLVVRQKWAWLRIVARDRRRLLMALTAASVLSFNWGVYNWAVLNGHVVDGSLGYFMNPLITVVLGVVLLHERLRPAQVVAVAFATVAVVVLTVDTGGVPWIGLTVGSTFATYGLIKKFIGMPPLESLAVETGFMVLPFTAVLFVLQARGDLVYGVEAPGRSALLMGVGIASVLPLLAFAAAMPRLPLSTMGLLQYITPATQFVAGVLVFQEDMPAARWAGFAIVWVALTIFAVDAWRAARRAARRPGGPRHDPVTEAELAPEPT